MSYAIQLLTAATGLFFFTTGMRKVFLPNVRKGVFSLFDKLGVPKEAGWTVILGEMFGGIALLLPFPILHALAAPLLLPIMFGAFFMDTLPTIKEKKQPKDASQWISNVLCTPESQLIIILSALTLHYWS